MKARALLLVPALVLAGCDSDEEGAGARPSTSGATTATTAPDAGEPPECRASEFDVTYPAGWWTNEAIVAESIPACSFFHPEPVTLEFGTEQTGIAIDLGVDGLWSDLRQTPTNAEVLSERSGQVEGHQAVRYEIRSLEDTILPAGTATTVWVVNLDPLGLVATTSAVAGLDYEENRAVLDRMVESLEFPDEPRCSASGQDPQVGPQDIPEPVAATRRAVAEAAAACDYAQLDRLAGPGFTAGFGGETGPPSLAWRRGEAQGTQPMRFLVGMLERPVRRAPGAEPPIYAWPSAYAFESWAAVPAADREALRPLYDDTDFEDFARFGAYSGWRAGITGSGDWTYYVAGD